MIVTEYWYREQLEIVAERDKLKEWCRKLIEGGTFPGEADGLRAERDRLRAALEEIAALEDFAYAIPKGIARRALEGK
jgi:hypothetical protein